MVNIYIYGMVLNFVNTLNYYKQIKLNTMNNNKNKHSASGIVVYFNEEKTSLQICRPKMEGVNRFEGRWSDLASAIAGNRAYHSFEVI